MKKYRCPKCGETFLGKLSICPNCSTPLHYLDEDIKKDNVQVKQTFFYEDDDVISTGLDEKELQEELRKAEEEEYKHNLILDDDGNPISFYDGNAFMRFLLRLLTLLMAVCTAFIALPWAMCIRYKYEYKHTVIEGRRLYFDGNGWQLFGRYLLWLLLTIVTLFLFLFVLLSRIQKWKTKHTHFQKISIKKTKI